MDVGQLEKLWKIKGPDVVTFRKLISYLIPLKVETVA